MRARGGFAFRTGETAPPSSEAVRRHGTRKRGVHEHGSAPRLPSPTPDDATRLDASAGHHASAGHDGCGAHAGYVGHLDSAGPVDSARSEDPVGPAPSGPAFDAGTAVAARRGRTARGGSSGEHPVARRDRVEGGAPGAAPSHELATWLRPAAPLAGSAGGRHGSAAASPGRFAFGRGLGPPPDRSAAPSDGFALRRSLVVPAGGRLAAGGLAFERCPVATATPDGAALGGGGLRFALARR